MIKAILVLALPLLIFSCGQNRERESYGMTSSADLNLTKTNHAHGFAQRDCFYCHVKANIHRIDTLGTNLIELAKTTTEEQGENGCTLCHGDNGVAQ